MRVHVWSGEDAAFWGTDELTEFFPDDAEECAKVEAQLRERGKAMYGGGAQPFFIFKIAKEETP